jgi:hypothetical protein
VGIIVRPAPLASWTRSGNLLQEFLLRLGQSRQTVGVRAMVDGRLRCLFWRVADDLDYLVTLVKLRILDALAGPLPETPADQQRARRIERAFPGIDP